MQHLALLPSHSAYPSLLHALPMQYIKEIFPFHLYWPHKLTALTVSYPHLSIECEHIFFTFLSEASNYLKMMHLL